MHNPQGRYRVTIISTAQSRDARAEVRCVFTDDRNEAEQIVRENTVAGVSRTELFDYYFYTPFVPLNPR